MKSIRGKATCCCAVLLAAIWVCGMAPGANGQLQTAHVRKVGKAASTSGAQKQAAPLLQVQIVASDSGRGRFIVFAWPCPHLRVVVRNVSRRAVIVFQEGNSWGHDNVHLEVSAVNGRRLKKLLLIARGPRPWRANAPTTQLLAPGQSIARDLLLHLPATVKFPNRKPTIAELNQDSYPQGDEYWFFPFPPKSQTATLTMKAVFEVVPDQVTKNTKIWTGRVASTPADYQVSWNPQRP